MVQVIVAEFWVILDAEMLEIVGGVVSGTVERVAYNDQWLVVVLGVVENVAGMGP